jgi:FixJ family two-component response regulator
MFYSPTPASAPGKGRSVSRQALIAVIEDDDSFRPALVESLLSLGYDARDFASAEEFLAFGELNRYGCVISDIHLTGMSGIDLKHALATRQIQVPVVMITARSEPGLEERVAASGAICLLKKPFEAAALLECLEKALQAR